MKNLLKQLRKKKLWPLSEALKTPQAKAVFFGWIMQWGVCNRIAELALGK